MKLLTMIAKCDTLGKINRAYASPQGLYHILRDCANNNHRHLLRTVDPNLTIPVMREIDTAIRDTLCRIFDIPKSEMSEILLTRISLPGRHGGMGMITYEDAARPAYMGCINANAKILDEHFRLHHLSLDHVDAHTFISTELADLTKAPNKDPQELVTPLSEFQDLLKPIPKTRPKAKKTGRLFARHTSSIR